MTLLLTVLACGLGDDPGTTASTTTTPATVLPTGDRVLLYHGSGGADPRGFGSAEFAEAAEYLRTETGLGVDLTASMPDLAGFRSVVLLDPGSESGEAMADGEVQALVDALAAGTRVAVVTSFYAACNAELLNGLLERLGARARLTGTHVPVASLVVEAPSASHQITQGVAEVWLGEPCAITPAGATTLVVNDRDAHATVERPGNGGEVALFGDYRWMDDSSLYEDGDNRLMLRNLVWVLDDPGT